MAVEGAPSPHVRVVWGTGTGPTDVASYDAALADANLQDYNLATVSSVVPPGATVAVEGTAPDLGPVGGRLWVVQARTTTHGPGRATAALGWATDTDGGVFYEAAGALQAADARERVRSGLAAARELRGRELPEEAVRSTTVDVSSGTYGTAVCLAVYGEAESMF